MSAGILAVIYVFMLIFDAFVIGGAAYLMVVHKWSAWWMLAAALLAAGSNPRYLMEAWVKTNTQIECEATKP